jgi:hypothetical protein
LLLSCAGFPFAAHRVLATEHLNPSAWTTLAFVSADALGIFAFADTNTLKQRFYRAASPGGALRFL